MSYFTAFIGMSIGAAVLTVTNIITARQNKRLRRENEVLSGSVDLLSAVILHGASDEYLAAFDEYQATHGDNEDNENE